MTPAVTVIVATHNRPDFLFRCLLAIKLQSFTDFECIVVGDNCNYSETVVRYFQKEDERFKYYKFVGKRPLNQGAVAKNIALKFACGKYIAYCDDDNILLPNHLEVLYATMDGRECGYVRSMFYHCEHSDIENLLLKEDLYFGNHSVNIDWNDALVMMHWNDGIRWTEKENLIDMHEDTHFLRRYTLQDVTSVPTAIYHQHKGEHHKDGHYATYLKLLDVSYQTYVYHNRIDALALKYLK